MVTLFANILLVSMLLIHLDLIGVHSLFSSISLEQRWLLSILCVHSCYWWAHLKLFYRLRKFMFLTIVHRSPSRFSLLFLNSNSSHYLHTFVVVTDIITHRTIWESEPFVLGFFLFLYFLHIFLYLSKIHLCPQIYCLSLVLLILSFLLHVNNFLEIWSVAFYLDKSLSKFVKQFKLHVFFFW